MLNRIKQGINYFFPKIEDKDIELAKGNLNNKEYEIFNNMSKYDKFHSINVLKEVMQNEMLKNNLTYRKLALLHDCGKNDIGFIERAKYVIYGSSDKLGKHHGDAFELLKDIDMDLAKLAKEHHNKSTENMKLREFQKIDSNN